MAGEAAVIGLLYRADWTRLSLAAVTSDGATLLMAPGRRYRYESADYVTGSDGTRAWEMPGDDEDETASLVRWVSSPQPPVSELLSPAWLLTGSQLQVRGRTRACGRDAYDVLVTPRPGIGPSVSVWLRRPMVAAVDAELGIVLRLVRDADAPDPPVAEFVSLNLDVDIDPVRFAPPPGSRLGESVGEALGDTGPAGRVVKTVAGLAAGGLGAWIRHSRATRREPAGGHDGDGEDAIPPGDPAPETTADGEPAGPPVSDELLARLQEGGAGHFAAVVYEWLDVGAMAAQIPDGVRRLGLGGLGALADAIGEQPAARVVRAVRFGGPGQYRIDHENAPRGGRSLIACDGQRRWQVQDGTATVGSAGPPPKDVADLADPSWLLQCRLSGGEPVTIDGRGGYRLSATRGRRGVVSMMFRSAVAVLDAELGLVQRLSYYMGGRLVQHYELRDITASDEDFRVDLPPGLTFAEETSRFGDARNGPPTNFPLAIATVIGRQAAKQAGKAARELLNRLQGHQPPDDD